MKILAIVIRNLHMGYLGFYGNEWIHTPTLDHLATQSVVFDQHLAVRPDFAGFCHAWDSGDGSLPSPDPLQHPESPGPSRLEDLLTGGGIAYRWIAEARAAEAGERVRTALVDLATNPHWLVRLDLIDLTSAWQFADDVWKEYAEGAELDGDVPPVRDAAPGFIDDDDDAILALQVSYGAAVTRVDVLLGELLPLIDDEVMILVTADRGEALGEHGIVGNHRPWMHEELIHLPLLVRLPSSAQAERRVAALTQATDLLPTLCDSFGLAAPNTSGTTLWPLMRGECSSLREFVRGGLRQGERVEWFLRSLEWHLLVPLCGGPDDHPREIQLYVKPDDRWEVNNVRHHQQERTDQLQQQLER